MMASAQVVEMSVNTNNSPSQDYTTNLDDHSNYKYCHVLSFSQHEQAVHDFEYKIWMDGIYRKLVIFKW